MGSPYRGAVFARTEVSTTTLLSYTDWLKAGDVVVDIGANTGEFTVAAAQKVGS